MCGARVLTLLALLVGSAHTFTWDIVLGEDKRFEFYNNGTLTLTEYIPSATAIISVTYNPVHYRLLFADLCKDRTLSISSFDMSTKKVQLVVKRTALGFNVRLAYDPVTQLLFWNDEVGIRSTSLNPASSNENVDGYLFMSLYQVCRDIAVDSCGGYIYWITDHGMERARLDGSERKVLIDKTADFRRSLAIDQKTQTMYWTETYGSFHNNEVQVSAANIDGNYRKTLHIIKDATFTTSLVISNEFIYWQQYIHVEAWLWYSLRQEYKGIWQLRRSASQQARQLYSSPKSGCWGCHLIAAYYTVEEQIPLIKSCDSLRYLISNYSKSESTVSICQNYCLHGNCSVSAEGHPTCSCNAGYSGERFEVKTCQDYCLHGEVCTLNKENKRVCQCTVDYSGERCEVFICKNYCLYGNCSVGAEGQPECSCNIGYSGERCEVNVCQEYCLNGGVCFLNEENEPACQCAAGYDGGRCEVHAYKNNSCDSHPASACHQFCLNDGVCSLNEASEPVCECTVDHKGDRCEISVNNDFSFQLVASVLKGQTRVTITVDEGMELTCDSAVDSSSEVVPNEFEMCIR